MSRRTRYAPLRYRRKILRVLESGGRWTRRDIGRAANVSIRYVDSTLRIAKYLKDVDLKHMKGRPVYYEIVKKD